MKSTGVKLLWGTANLFSHPRYMGGASTNPDPEVFTYAAAQVKKALEVTKRLGGENYVLWGGREGYETLLNTDMKRELDQMGRFMNMVVEHKHKIGFKGPLLIEPKPREPTKHQYDYDSATVDAFFQRYGLSPNDFRVNIEANHATLAGHSFEHEVAYALASGIFGSIDMNRGDPQLGWDTDQFGNDIAELSLVVARIVAAGGFTTGGFNFDAKVRRQSNDLSDLFHGHVGGMDNLARALLIADKMLSDGKLQGFIDERYAGWNEQLGKDILAGKLSLADLSEQGAGRQAGSEAALGPPGDAREPGQPVSLVISTSLATAAPPWSTRWRRSSSTVSSATTSACAPGSALPTLPLPGRRPEANTTAFPIEAAAYVAWHGPPRTRSPRTPPRCRCCIKCGCGDRARQEGKDGAGGVFRSGRRAVHRVRVADADHRGAKITDRLVARKAAARAEAVRRATRRRPSRASKLATRELASSPRRRRRHSDDRERLRGAVRRDRCGAGGRAVRGGVRARVA